KRPSQHPKLSRRIQRRFRNVRRAFYGVFYRMCYWLLPKLPSWMIRVLGRLLVVPVSRVLHWRTAEANLIKVYGDELSAAERHRILVRMFRGLPAFLVECIGALNQGAGFLRGRVEDTSARKLVADLEARSEKGWIGVAPHLGNWVLVATWAGSLPGDGRRCHAIAKRQPNPHLSAILDDAQKRMGFMPIYGDRSPVQVVGECLKLLKRGARLGIAPDQDISRLPGVFIEFLGHRAYTPTGPAQLALTVDVPILPLALVRKDDGRLEVIHGEPIFPDQSRTRSRQEETLRLTKAWSAAMETMIHAHRDQWFWFHERWKTTPEKLAARARET
ncbi:MAG: lysophospholipid acyltransferase family protein, partial [Planctomycetota bacterium]